MSYGIAGIDVHKKMLTVVVADVEVEARSAVRQGNQETGEVRRPHHRRDGICATKSRGDGGRVHTVGGAL
jgi:hypothetical protein